MQNNKDNSNQSKHSFKKDNQMEKQKGVQERFIMFKARETSSSSLKIIPLIFIR